MNYFCTLFNIHYLAKGLAMIESLEARCTTPYQLYVLSMDSATLDYFKSHPKKNVFTISLQDFENDDLKNVKSGRTTTEYCWTCTPAIIRYCLTQFNLPECTYLDADLYFFDNPQILLDEVKSAGRDVLITPHNYTRIFDQSETSGIYCVQFMYFKNTTGGRKVLERWYEQCIAWCFARVEDGKLGDQKYLDSWLIDFPIEVHSLNHWGTVAPWNVQKYSLLQKSAGKIELKRGSQVMPLVFYHFHGFKALTRGGYTFGTYPFSETARRLIYTPYIHHLEKNKIAPDRTEQLAPFRVRFKMWVYERLYFLLRL